MVRLAVRCAPDQAELVLAELTVLSPGGVEEAGGEGYVEYAIYGAAGELPELGVLDAAIGDGLVEVSATEVADDWADRWREFHRPVTVGGAEAGAGDRPRIRLRPPWEPAEDGAIEVVIDPGMAFGTGAHPTTRLCIGFLCDLAAGGGARGPVSDLGAGSGVLAISAAALGFSPVTGYDSEPAAIEAAEANAAANAVDPDRVRFERLDLRRGLPALMPLTVANLTAPLLEAVAAGMDSETVPERLVCSGLLDSEIDRVASAFEPLGLLAHEDRVADGWAGLLLEAG